MLFRRLSASALAALALAALVLPMHALGKASAAADASSATTTAATSATTTSTDTSTTTSTTPAAPVASTTSTTTTTSTAPATPTTTTTAAAAPATMTTTAAQPATTTTAAQGPGATWGAGTKKSADAQARDHLARTASDPGVSIVDYSFSPGSITIQQGDTITWVNNGKQPHTATASNGSFDTGTLKPGASASHTFSTAGTFAYICSIHPFMHGTVVVQAASSTPSSSGSSGSSTSGTSSGASTTPSTGTTAQAAVPVASGPSLPNTGLNLIASMIAAMVLVAAGVVLRRRSRA